MEYLFMEGKGIYIFYAYGFAIICMSLLALYLLVSLSRARQADILMSNKSNKDGSTISSVDE